MKTKHLITLLLTLMTGTLHAQDQNFWIFLCFGQSNMAGQAPMEQVDSIVPDRLLSMSATEGTDGRHIGEWRKAVPPVCRQDTHLSPADYFGRTVLAAAPAGTRVGIISVAVEGCPLTFFDKDKYREAMQGEQRDWMLNILRQYDNDPYGRLVTLARKAQHDGVIKGILLHQGETDAYTPEWQQRVHKIYTDLCADLRLDSAEVPMLVGETIRQEYGGVCAHANPTIDGLDGLWPGIHVVSAAGCTPSEDNVHFSTEGYRQLGRNYAARYQAVKSGTATSLATAATDAASSALQVEAIWLTGGTMLATATEPVEEVSIVSFSGQTIQRTPVSHKRKFGLHYTNLPDETLIFVFKSVTGATCAVKR